jgi:Ulp1 family protease
VPEPPLKKQKLSHSGTNGSMTTSSQSRQRSPSVTSIPDSATTRHLTSSMNKTGKSIVERPGSAHEMSIMNGSRPRKTARTDLDSTNPFERRRLSTAKADVKSPYFAGKHNNGYSNDPHNPQTVESGSDGEEAQGFLHEAKARRKADRIPTVSPTRSMQVTNTNGVDTSETTPMHVSDSKHLYAPAESPDALQDDFEEPDGATPGALSVLKSPKNTVARLQRQARGQRKAAQQLPLASLIDGDTDRGKLQRQPKHTAPPSNGPRKFSMLRVAGHGLIPNANLYDFIVDKSDKVCWINNTSLNILEPQPVKGPWKVANIFNIIYGNESGRLVMLKFRGSQTPSLVFELKSHKEVVDLTMLLQAIDISLKISTKDTKWLEQAYENTVKLPAPQKSSVMKLAPAADLRERRKHKPEDAERTRDRLDPPQKQMTVISGNERSGASTPPQVSTRRTRNSTEYDQQLSSAPSEEHNELTQTINGRPHRARATRRTQEREPTPTRPVIKFSETVGLGKPWKKALIYPPEAKKQVEVDFGSLKRFDDDEFLNDTLINFFLRYLQFQTEVSNSRYSTKLHFFNTYFYENLTKGTKGKGINFDAVKKWTKTVNLFSRDFVVIPVNENLHWYAIIICNLSSYNQSAEEAAEEDENDQVQEIQKPDDNEDTSDTTKATRETQESFEDLTIGSSPAQKAKGRKKKKKKVAPLKKYDTKKPVIITLDSLGLGRTATCRLIKEYIVALGVDHGKEIDIDELKAMTAKDIPLQNNFSDCGLYVCMYLEQFIKNPYQFVENILQRKVEVGWPDKPDGSDLRHRMRNLIMELHRVQDGEQSQWNIPELGSVLVDMQDPSKAPQSSETAVNDKDEEPGDRTSRQEPAQDIPELKSDLPALAHERSVADHEPERPTADRDYIPSPPRKFKRMKTKAPEHSISNEASTSHPPPRKLSPQHSATSPREPAPKRKELKKTEVHLVPDDSDDEPELARHVRGGKRPRLSTPAALEMNGDALQQGFPQPSPTHVRASPADSVTTQNLQNGMHLSRFSNDAARKEDIDDRNDDDLPAWAESPAEEVDLDALEHGVDQQAGRTSQGSTIPETPDADISQRELLGRAGENEIIID